MQSKIGKKLLYEFVYGGHLLSLGASSIVWAVMIISGVEIKPSLLILAYLSSQIVYNHDHLGETKNSGESTNPERTKHLLETKKYQIISLVAYIVLFILIGMSLPLPSFILAIAIVIGGVLYTIRMKKLTKRFLGFKNLYIAFFWSALTFLIPFYSPQLSINLFFMVIALFIFIRWIINSAYFDIKDLKSDKQEGLKTLPAVFGLAKVIYFLHVLNVLSGFIILVSVILALLPTFVLSMLVFPLYSFYYLVKTKDLTPRQLRLVSYFMVDGEYLLWPIVLLLGRMLFK